LAQFGASPEISFMQMPSRLGILFNGAALLILGATVAAAVRFSFMSDDIAPCSTRYEHGTQLSLARPGGELLTPADLQARSAGTDWGLENTRIIEARGGSAKQAIEVRFTPAKASAMPADGKVGMGFSWMPRSAGKPAAACLTYSVFLSKDFDFAKGGRLPGFVASAGDQDAAAGTVSSRIAWRESGGLELRAQMADWLEPRRVAGDKIYILPRGQWVALEQEIVLNTPGAKDGALRVWADGAMVLEKTGLVIREKAQTQISGVLAETTVSPQPGTTLPKDQKVLLSPPELRWQ
jgi:hypothetical protein